MAQEGDRMNRGNLSEVFRRGLRLCSAANWVREVLVPCCTCVATSFDSLLVRREIYWMPCASPYGG